MESGMQQIFLLETGIPVPLTKNPESRTWNPESTGSNPEFKTIRISLRRVTKASIVVHATREFMLLHVCRKLSLSCCLFKVP